MIERNDIVGYFQTCSKIFEGQFGAALQIGAILLVVLVFNFFIKSILFSLFKKYKSQQKIWALSFVSALYKPLNYFVWILAGLAALDLVMNALLSMHLRNFHLMLSISAILTFCWFLLRWNKKFLHHSLEVPENASNPQIASKLDLMSKIATLGILFITALLLLDATGRSMETIIAFGGIGGLALAFASQQVVSNFFGGLMVYTTKPFTIGEWVSLPDRSIEGTVEEIGWYLTRIRNFEKRPIYVPNSIFSQSVVINPSRMSHWRFHHTIKLKYCDIELLKKVNDEIKLMLLKHPEIDQNVRIDVNFLNFGPSNLEVNVSAFVPTSAAGHFFMVRQDLLLQVAQIIKSCGAELATPTQIIDFKAAEPKTDSENLAHEMPPKE